jgi:hypothetical protein
MGPIPSLITSHGQVLRLENQRPMAHGELTHEMALDSHIHLGNHEIIHADRLTLVTSLYPVRAHNTGSLDPVGEPHPE